MTLKELYSSLYDKSTPREPRLFVNAIEKNLQTIDDVDLSKRDDYEYAMWLISDYAIQLETLGYLKKSLEYFDKALKLFEEFPSFQKDNLFEQRYYELLKFHKARALFNLKKHKESLSIFIQLDKAFPNNEMYLSWIYGIKGWQYKKIAWIGFALITIGLAINIFKGTIPKIDFIAFLLIITGLVISISFKIAGSRAINKFKKYAT
jgi:tetratricopeptide (TPR) repeat protein